MWGQSNPKIYTAYIINTKNTVQSCFSKTDILSELEISVLSLFNSAFEED